jgi:DNA (cytosine-5)-methyltransferase 1
LENLGGRPAAAEFFAGIGLVRLALERQGFRVAFANDIDEDKLEIYRDNFTADDFHLGDIHELSAASVPDCELFTASFPCNDLSIAGARAGLAGGQSSAFWGLVRILEDKRKRPSLVLLENVPGFLNSHGGRDFETALGALNALGYACDAFLLDAARFVPQSRLRMFVVAKLEAAGRPAAGLQTSAVRPANLVNFIESHPQIRWDIAELPSPPVRRDSLESILEDLPDDDPAWWNSKRADYLMGQLSQRHAAVASEMIAGGAIRFATAFRRVRNGRSMAELRTDGIAGCLRTPRGGSGRQILFKAGRGRYQVRLLTARECARLQGVPDSFKINVRLNQALFGFGDAVCVPAVEWIAENYLRPYLQCAGSATGIASRLVKAGR